MDLTMSWYKRSHPGFYLMEYHVSFVELIFSLSLGAYAFGVHVQDCEISRTRGSKPGQKSYTDPAVHLCDWEKPLHSFAISSI